MRDRREAWAKYEAGQEDQATKLFEARGGLQQWDLWKMVLRIFRHRNVEFLVAPYVAWAQVRAIRLFICTLLTSCTPFGSSSTFNATLSNISTRYTGPPTLSSILVSTSSSRLLTWSQQRPPSSMSQSAPFLTNSVSRRINSSTSASCLALNILHRSRPLSTTRR